MNLLRLLSRSKIHDRPAPLVLSEPEPAPKKKRGRTRKTENSVEQLPITVKKADAYNPLHRMWISEDGVWTKSPYNEHFITSARLLRGKWDREKKLWRFDASYAAAVRELMQRHYGSTGEDFDPCEIMIEFNESRILTKKLTVLGRDLMWGARDFKNWSNVVVIPGWECVVQVSHYQIEGFLLSDGPNRGEPALRVHPGTIVYVRQVDRNAVPAWISALQGIAEVDE